MRNSLFESAAKSRRAAAEHHGKSDHMKGNEPSVEAQKHSKGCPLRLGRGARKS
jgi:hypothetical protein